MTRKSLLVICPVCSDCPLSLRLIFPFFSACHLAAGFFILFLSLFLSHYPAKKRKKKEKSCRALNSIVCVASTVFLYQPLFSSNPVVGGVLDEPNPLSWPYSLFWVFLSLHFSVRRNITWVQILEASKRSVKVPNHVRQRLRAVQKLMKIYAYSNVGSCAASPLRITIDPPIPFLICDYQWTWHTSASPPPPAARCGWGKNSYRVIK